MRTKWHILRLVLLSGLLVLGFVQLSNAQNASTAVSVVPSHVTAQQGETLIVNVTISNVENLYGIDLTLRWNNSMLSLQDFSSQMGVESRPGGILHEDAEYPVIIVQDNASQSIGEYYLVATSQGSADSFNGSGTIVTLTFNVTAAGKSEISVQSELADHPQPGETTSELIPHSDGSSTIDAAPIPEFPETAALIALAAIVTMALLYSKIRKK